MCQLYETVMDMPTHDRQTLKKNERMRLDLQRERAEADLEQNIKLEIQRLLNYLKNLRKNKCQKLSGFGINPKSITIRSRYTSYPTALEFNESYTDKDFSTAATRYPTRPLSLYVHIPFVINFVISVRVTKLLLVINIK